MFKQHLPWLWLYFWSCWCTSPISLSFACDVRRCLATNFACPELIALATEELSRPRCCSSDTLDGSWGSFSSQWRSRSASAACCASISLARSSNAFLRRFIVSWSDFNLLKHSKKQTIFLFHLLLAQHPNHLPHLTRYHFGCRLHSNSPRHRPMRHYQRKSLDLSERATFIQHTHNKSIPHSFKFQNGNSKNKKIGRETEGEGEGKKKTISFKKKSVFDILLCVWTKCPIRISSNFDENKKL